MKISGWSSVKLGEVTAKVGSGATPRGGKESYYTEGVPFIRSLNVHFDRFLHDGLVYLDEKQAAELDNVKVKAGDVLLNITGASIGRVNRCPEALDGARVNQHVCIIRPIPQVDAAFLRYYLSSPQLQQIISQIQTGVTRQALTKEMILNFELPIAPVNEQARIVAKIEELFSELDAGVAALERVRAGLKRYRAAVLKAAVEGKLTEDWRAQHPDTEPASVLLERILAERRRKWEEAQLAKFAQTGKQPPKGWREKYPEPRSLEKANRLELPDGWCGISLDQIVARSEYGTSVKCDYQADGPPVLRIPNIARGDLDLQDVKRATAPIEIPPDDELLKGDMLVCRTNGSISLIGKAALVKSPLQPPHTFASYLLRFRLVEPEILPKWTHVIFSSRQGRSFIERHATSSAGQHNVSLSLLNGMPLPLPPHAEQRAIVAEVERRLSLVDEVEAQVEANLKRAARLRQGILKRAFEGKLVPQDPSDEPAERLLDRIRESRQVGSGANGGRKAARPRLGRARRGHSDTPLFPTAGAGEPGGGVA